MKKFIVICGQDGSGKTTQINFIQSYLEKQNVKTFITKQPTAWYRSDPFVRNFLRKNATLPEIQALALFSAADRLKHYYQEIEVYLKKGYTVISDRYMYSFYALFMARGLDFEYLKQINKYVPPPDVAFYLDVRPSILYQRIIDRDGSTEKFEENSLPRMAQIRDNFLNLKGLITLDGEEKPEKLFSEIKKKIH